MTKALRNTSFGAAIASALAAPLVFSAPSQAQGACATSGVGGTDLYNIGALTGLGSTGCQIGDKVYSDFSFSGFTSGAFTFTQIGDFQHTFSGSGLALAPTGPYTYSYKVTPLDPSQFIDTYRTDIASSFIGPATTASNALANNQSGGISTATLNPNTQGANVDLPDAFVPVVFTGTINVINGRVDTLTDSLIQKGFTPQASAPSPLPILGAAAAFGSVRKLRRFSALLKA